ncbi:MAG: LemA family protein [Bdellovibrionales bacterium]|nr:LemA family protein [Bdellovibrionales bacterium]
MNKTVLAVLGGFVGLVLLMGLWFVSVGNTMVELDEGVNKAKAQVENVYQRRMDLIPNLVATVKGYAKHEASVLEEVTKARASASQVNLSGEGAVKRFEQAQGQLGSALSRLMVTVEKYPDLKANQNFRDLQSQLEGTENRITIERQRFNDSCNLFNTYTRKFPQSFVAAFRGFKEKEYFQAQAGAATAPKVEF